MNEKIYSPQLDGIRGIAILQVVIFHYFVSQTRTDDGSVLFWIARFLNTTWSGVDLFFVLSGFLIGGILMDNLTARNYFRVFYVRRFLRILPLYYLVLLLFFVGSYSTIAQAPGMHWIWGHVMPVWSYASLTQNFVIATQATLGGYGLAVTWSLAVEAQFYLLLPFLLRYVSQEKIARILVGSIMVAPVLRMFLYFSMKGHGLAGYVLLPTRIDSLFFGVLVAYGLRHWKLTELCTSNRRLLYAVVIIGWIVTICVGVVADGPGSFVNNSYGYAWIAALYACFLLLAVSEKNGPISCLTRFPMLRGLGRISYGVYLFHQPIRGLTHAVVTGQPPQVSGAAEAVLSLVALVATFSVSIATWYLIEKTFISLGHSFRYSRCAPISLNSTF